MAESNSRRRRKAEPILRYEAEPPAEDPADYDTEDPLVKDPADAEAEVPPEEHDTTTGHEVPAVAVQVGVSVTASDTEESTDETPGAVRVGEPPAAKEDEAPATEAVAGEEPGEVPTTAEDWLTTTYWVVLVDGREERYQQLIVPQGTLVPVAILPPLRLEPDQGPETTPRISPK